ncbi:MAG: DUF305 domain-containing protein [Brevundimonas sp.]|nr:MAG: DUF305 domain-containing protein [Brevundimonas sp.]
MAGLITAPQNPPPIFHPGAPGAASRSITAGEAVALSRTTFTAGDVAFMQHMIVHHGQAVEMVALLEAQGANPTVKLLGRRIALSQEAEIGIMRDWLTDRGQPLAMPGMDHGGMDHSAHAGMAGMADMPASETPLMPGMLSPAQMQRLAAARGADFEKLFLEGMIQHHRGALDMVDGLLAQPGAAEDPLLSDFTTSVVADQSAEILRMQNVQSDL